MGAIYKQIWEEEPFTIEIQHYITHNQSYGSEHVKGKSAHFITPSELNS